jgi:hypothetical protein
VTGHQPAQSPPATVPATLRFLALVAESEFAVLEDFHPAWPGSVTLVDPHSRSAITVAIVESADADEDQP